MNGDEKSNSDIAKEILSSLALSDVCEKKPSELSSGMAQRVSLAPNLLHPAGIYVFSMSRCMHLTSQPKEL